MAGRPFLGAVWLPQRGALEHEGLWSCVHTHTSRPHSPFSVPLNARMTIHSSGSPKPQVDRAVSRMHSNCPVANPDPKCKLFKDHIWEKVGLLWLHWLCRNNSLEVHESFCSSGLRVTPAPQQQESGQGLTSVNILWVMAFIVLLLFLRGLTTTRLNSKPPHSWGWPWIPDSLPLLLKCWDGRHVPCLDTWCKIELN